MKRRSFLNLTAGAAAAPLVKRAWAQQAGSITVTGISSFRLVEDLIPRFTQETGIAVDLQIRVAFANTLQRFADAGKAAMLGRAGGRK